MDKKWHIVVKAVLPHVVTALVSALAALGLLGDPGVQAVQAVASTLFGS